MTTYVLAKCHNPAVVGRGDQTLYAAVARVASTRVLRWGIPGWSMGASVVLGFWVGFIGVALAIPGSFALAKVADQLGVQVLLPAKLLAAAVTVTMVMAMLSGLLSLRSLRLVEPAMLLR